MNFLGLLFFANCIIGVHGDVEIPFVYASRNISNPVKQVNITMWCCEENDSSIPEAVSMNFNDSIPDFIVKYDGTYESNGTYSAEFMAELDGQQTDKMTTLEYIYHSIIVLLVIAVIAVICFTGYKLRQRAHTGSYSFHRDMEVTYIVNAPEFRAIRWGGKNFMGDANMVYRENLV